MGTPPAAPALADQSFPHKRDEVPLIYNYADKPNTEYMIQHIIRQAIYKHAPWHHGDARIGANDRIIMTRGGAGCQRQGLHLIEQQPSGRCPELYPPLHGTGAWIY